MFETIAFRIEGITRHVQSNGQTADPINEYAARMKEITDKRMRMTAEDRRRLAELQWEASLYLDDLGRPCVPGNVIVGALVEAARKFSKGPLVRAGVQSTRPYWPLEYDGPKDLEGLREEPRFRFRALVSPRGKTKGGKVAKSRVCFNEWALDFEVMYLTTILSRPDVIRFVHVLGTDVGLSDDRTIMGGRFRLLEVDAIPFEGMDSVQVQARSRKRKGASAVTAGNGAADVG